MYMCTPRMLLITFHFVSYRETFCVLMGNFCVLMGNVCVLLGNVCVLLGKNKTCNIFHSNEKTNDRMTIVMKCEPKFESIVPVKIIISSNDLFFLFCVLIISSIFYVFCVYN